jgi:serine protease Do
MKAMGISVWTYRIRNSGWPTRVAIVATLGVGILLGTLISNGVRAARPVPGDAQPLSVPSPVQLSSEFNRVAEMVEPAVVNITSQSTPVRARRGPRAPSEDPFERFFGPFFDREPERAPRRGLGSGIVVDPAGYILTNHHVIEGADKITVQLSGENKDYRAQVVGFDNETDLAVIKIDAGRMLPAAKMGNSDAARVGDWVLAIGSPFGLDATVTAGIISYKGRPGMEQFQRFIQTDAAINHGNSGGPLVNMAGEVIGVNTAILASQGAFAGVGFALPSNTAIQVYNQLVQHGRMVRGSIGITFDSRLSQNRAALTTFGAEHGVVISEVTPGGPAQKAGLRHGDVIYQVGDKKVQTGDDLVNTVSSTPIGQKLPIYYIRDKEKKEATVVVEDRTKVFPQLAGGSPEPEPGEEEMGRLGLTVEQLTPAQAQNLGLEIDEPVLIVRDVEPGSLADELGVDRNMILLEVNRLPVRNPAQLRGVEQALKPGDSVVLYLRAYTRNGWTGFYRYGTVPE